MNTLRSLPTIARRRPPDRALSALPHARHLRGGLPGAMRLETSTIILPGNIGVLRPGWLKTRLTPWLTPANAPVTKLVKGWPKLWANFRSLIGIFSQSVAIWANPVQFSFAGGRDLRLQARHAAALAADDPLRRAREGVRQQQVVAGACGLRETAADARHSLSSVSDARHRGARPMHSPGMPGGGAESKRSRVASVMVCQARTLQGGCHSLPRATRARAPRRVTIQIEPGHRFDFQSKFSFVQLHGRGKRVELIES